MDDLKYIKNNFFYKALLASTVALISLSCAKDPTEGNVSEIKPNEVCLHEGNKVRVSHSNVYFYKEGKEGFAKKYVVTETPTNFQISKTDILKKGMDLERNKEAAWFLLVQSSGDKLWLRQDSVECIAPGDPNF